MRQFWSWLAVWCGKHAGLVGVIGLLLTLTLAAGTTQLKFQTSQASYLNRTDQIYKDDVRYEQLFGGQAMVVMFTMNDGATIDQFFTPENVTKLDALVAQLHAGATQHQIVNKLQQVVLGDVPFIPITEEVGWFQYNTSSFTGWPSPSDPYALPAAYAYPDMGQVLLHLSPK